MSLKIPKRKPAPSLSGTMKERLEAARARTKATRERKLAKAKAKKTVPLDMLVETWGRAWKSSGEKATCVLRKQDVVILLAEGKRYTATGGDFLPVVEWSVSNWKLIVDTRFSWMRDGGPATPDVRFFVKFAKDFYRAYEERERVEARKHMTVKERMIEDRVDRGMGREAAGREVNERLGIAKAIDQSSGNLKKLQLLQNLDQRRREAEDQRRRSIRERRRSVRPVMAETTNAEIEEGFGEWEE